MKLANWLDLRQAANRSTIPSKISLQICEVVPELSHDLCGSAFL